MSDETINKVVEQLSKGFGKVEQPKPQYSIHIVKDKYAETRGLMQVELILYKTNRRNYEQMVALEEQSRKAGVPDSLVNKFRSQYQRVCDNKRLQIK